MAKTPTKPTTDAESERLFRQSQLHRYVRVIGRYEDMIEISARPGHKISFVESVEDKRVVHIIAGPIKKPAASSKPG